MIKTTVAEYDAKIKQLQQKRRQARIAERKKIADETKKNEIKRNARLYEAMQNFLGQRGISDDDLRNLPVADIQYKIFQQPVAVESSPQERN